MAFTIEILDVDKTSLLKRGTLKVTRKSDHRNSCSFTIKTTAGAYLPDIGQDIKIKQDGTVIFGGVIKNHPRLRPGVGTSNTTVIFADIDSDGYHTIPARRTVNFSYDQATAGDIVDDCLNAGLLALEGITAGTIGVGTTPMGSGGEYDAVCKNLKTILDECASASGYKWYIDDLKQLQFYQEDSVVAAAHDIVIGGAFTDYKNVKVVPRMEGYANKVFVRADYGDDGYLITAIAQDPTEQTARQTAEGGSTYSSGVYGIVVDDTSIYTQADADIKAGNELKKMCRIPIELTFDSHTLDWVSGTKLKANLPIFGINADTYFLIEDVTLTDIDGKNLYCSLRCTRRDETDFSTQRTQTGVDYFAKVIEGSKSKNKIVSAVTDPITGDTYPIMHGVVQTWIATDLPAASKNNDVLVNTDNYSHYDQLDITAAVTLDIDGPEYNRCTGASIYDITLHTATQAGIIKIFKNLGSATFTLVGTVDGGANYDLTTGSFCTLITNGTDWDRVG